MKKTFILQQQEISFVKNTFTQNLIEQLGIIEVQGPILSEVGNGMQDNLSGIEKAVQVNVKCIPNAVYEVCCFIGIILKSAKDYEKVIKKLDTFDEVVEAYYTTGNYSIFIKVMTHTIAELHSVLATKIQLIDEIQSTETLISMQNPILRDIKP